MASYCVKGKQLEEWCRGATECILKRKLNKLAKGENS
jgi:hypothetical protein